MLFSPPCLSAINPDGSWATKYPRSAEDWRMPSAVGVRDMPRLICGKRTEKELRWKFIRAMEEATRVVEGVHVVGAWDEGEGEGEVPSLELRAM